ncbi:hypothetical protein GLOIN_2v1600827 [Rhizophagus irregularis DAOM 181602=DAOM 197198]|uniref:Uncharacterized protein n=1 Tax=Rhizophagus irregularis (strain DAOM 181602 / DAOM 197198 / MUCL 43194) TaxID=747089 RepID=A0A2P4Q309_RHIID|nr:hypothetical protein GLOIN_2v1600827 [Rhizophagus irregularis DAOM 181602=DAOM 197198]POG71998.1 hypothetical protein GLOIN_2v1600827 [Rhizophagus irregularis DAOM 181602=DAOM 197198]GET51474.1 hypothetical protein GLOIN_2v1600827 [Rhizophagus irregularis DAOM 181602=DAOM 197198]|eukprot:XP_025178864.1 hypothetical protein GLOIN_2v1600827 [Rhizophagus irregularis DAOM 181602=DAOM 197198]
MNLYILLPDFLFITLIFFICYYKFLMMYDKLCANPMVTHYQGDDHRKSRVKSINTELSTALRLVMIFMMLLLDIFSWKR